MDKLLGSRKGIILEMFAVFIVCAFLASSLVPSIGHSATTANTKSIYDVYSNPFVSSNNNSSNAGYVKYTLVLLNNTLVNGNFVNNAGNGIGPSGVAYDSSNGYLYVTNLNSNSVSVINGASNTVIDTIAVGLEPRGVAFDSSNGYLYVANYNSGTISIIATTTGSATYPVTFTESGLPNGTTWAVTFNGTTESSTTNAITFSRPNGTYSYTIGTVSGYSASPSSGSITVSGNNIKQAITFTPTTTSASKYTVTFTESGLPTGTTWYVNITGGASYSSATGTITFSEPNGTYTYTVATGDKEYAPSPASGSFIVNGATPVKVAITFTESGSSSQLGLNDYIIIAAVVIGVVIALILLVMYRRKKAPKGVQPMNQNMQQNPPQNNPPQQ